MRNSSYNQWLSTLFFPFFFILNFCFLFLGWMFCEFQFLNRSFICSVNRGLYGSGPFFLTCSQIFCILIYCDFSHIVIIQVHLQTIKFSVYLKQYDVFRTIGNVGTTYKYTDSNVFPQYIQQPKINIYRRI